MPMQYRRLGKSGLKVSELSLGSWITYHNQVDVAAAKEMLAVAMDAGVNFFDNAEVYAQGQSEVVMGEAIRALKWPRLHYVVSTKFFWGLGRDSGNPVNRIDTLNRKYLMQAIDGSLKRMQLDFVDLVFCHRPDPQTPIEETLAALDALVTAGKVRYVGVSNFLAYQLARALGRSDALRLVRFVSVQPRYNLLFRQPERELLPLCREEGLAVLPYNLLAGGLLAGKHDLAGEPVAGTRYTLPGAADLYRSQYWQPAELDAVGRIAAIAAEAGVALPTLAVAWVVARPEVTVPLVGASSPDQLDTVLAGADLELGADVLAALEKETAPFRRGDAIE